MRDAPALRVWIWVPAALTACGGGEAPADVLRVGVRDSAGVEIVTIDPGVLDEGEPVEVGRELLVEIGSLDGPEEYQLYRVADVTWLGDDRILVVDGMTEIRMYDLQGRHVRTMGGEGEGPGEFQRIMGIDVTPDGEVVVAELGRGLTILDSLGVYQRTVRTAPFIPHDGRVVDGRWWVGKIGNVTSRDPSRPERQIDSVLAVDLDSGEMETWIRVPGPYIHWESRANGERMATAKAFSPQPSVAVRGPVVVTTTGETYELKEWGPAGRLRRIVRSDVPAGEVTEEMRDQVRGNVEAMADRMPQVFEMVSVFHDSTGVITALDRDAAGRTWVRRRGSDPYTWDVFGSDGRFVARATWPEEFFPREIGRDRVLGMRMDSLGVPYVQVRALGPLPGG